MEENKNIKVLVVDDEKVVRDFLMRILSLQSVTAKAVEDGLKAVEAVKQEKFDLAFIDIRMPNMDGITAYGELKKIDFGMQCIFMTGYALEESLLDKTKQDGVICLKKPFQDIRQIREIISNAIIRKTESPVFIKSDVKERRAYVRLDIGFEVVYTVKDLPVHNEPVKIKNISPGGLKFSILDNLAPGTKVDLIIRAPGATNFCKACAEVVWNKPSKEQPGYFDTGLKFKEINLSELTAIIKQYSVF